MNSLQYTKGIAQDILTLVLCPGINISHGGCLRDGHIPECQPRDIHVKHDIRLQHPLQDKTTLYTRHEQGMVGGCWMLCFSFIYV